MRLEDQDLYSRVSRATKETAEHDAWVEKNPQYAWLQRDRIDSYHLTSREKNILNYLRGAVDDLKIDRVNARPFLRIIKIIDLSLKNEPMKTVRSSYLLRKQILELCSPEMSSCEAYTLTPDSEERGNLDYLCQPANWVPERVGHQAKAVAALFTEMNATNHRKPIFYAIRGNTASGKSTFLHRLFKTQTGFLSLDPLKFFLKRNVKLTNVQVYEEANALFANFLNGVFKQKALRFIFDSRLLSLDYIQRNVIDQAEKRGEEVRLIDLDVSLETSLKRTLNRDPYGEESCVPTDAVVFGFVQIRKERAALIALVKENPRITGYQLYHEGELVAEKKEGHFHIYNQERYNECLRLPTEDSCLWKDELDAKAYQIKARISVIPPDLVKFEIPSNDLLLAKYEDFYKKRYIAAEAKKTEGRVSSDGKTLYVQSNNYPSHNHFVAVPVVLRDEPTHQIIAITSRVDFDERNYFYTDLLEYAKEHEDPVRFLIDHYRFWSCHGDRIIDFLGGHITSYGVLDLFEQIDAYRVSASVGKALSHPSLKARATELLFKLGGLFQLAPYLHEEAIRIRFEQIAANSPDYYQRFAALNHLENTAPILHALEKEIYHRIVGPLINEPRYRDAVSQLMPGHADVTKKSISDQDYTRWWRSYNALLEEAILNPALSEETRITALRKCALSLFITTYISQSEHDLRAKANSTLAALLANPLTPKKLVREANRIKDWKK